MNLHLPESLTTTISEQYGETGRQWLQELPHIVQACIDQWELAVEPSSYGLSYNFIANVARSNGDKLVLKVGFPGEREFFTEMRALKVFAGRNSVRLLESDEIQCAMLLERVQPGNALTELLRTNPEEGCHIAATLIRDTVQPVPAEITFPSIEDWMIACGKTDAMLSNKDDAFRRSIHRAQTLFAELNATTKNTMLLHGDIHHENILYDEHRGWLTIDPKGIIGDPALNAARFLRYPKKLFNADPASIAPWLINEVGTITRQPPQRLAGWAYIDSVLGECWRIEAGESYRKEVIGYLALLEKIMNVPGSTNRTSSA